MSVPGATPVTTTLTKLPELSDTSVPNGAALYVPAENP